MITETTKREAAAIGASRYFTGRPCAHGHVAERLVSNSICVECARLRRAARRAADPELSRQQNRESHARNREKRNQQSRDYRRNNPEKWAAIDKASKERRKAEIAAYMREWRSRNSDAIKLASRIYRERFQAEVNARTRRWREENRDAYLANKAKRRADEMRATPAWADHRAIMEVYLEAARLQMATGVPHHVDHVIPLRGKLVCGLHVHQNLEPKTAAENMRKSNNFDPS